DAVEGAAEATEGEGAGFGVGGRFEFDDEEAAGAVERHLEWPDRPDGGERAELGEVGAVEGLALDVAEQVGDRLAEDLGGRAVEEGGNVRRDPLDAQAVLVDGEEHAMGLDAARDVDRLGVAGREGGVELLVAQGAGRLVGVGAHGASSSSSQRVIASKVAVAPATIAPRSP